MISAPQINAAYTNTIILQNSCSSILLRFLRGARGEGAGLALDLI